MARSLVSFRWGTRLRSPSAIVRVSASTRKLLDKIPDRFRREFVDRAVRSFLCSDWWISCKSKLDKGGAK